MRSEQRSRSLNASERQNIVPARVPVPAHFETNAVDPQRDDGADLDGKLDEFLDSIDQIPDLDERVE